MDSKILALLYDQISVTYTVLRDKLDVGNQPLHESQEIIGGLSALLNVMNLLLVSRKEEEVMVRKNTKEQMLDYLHNNLCVKQTQSVTTDADSYRREGAIDVLEEAISFVETHL